MWGRLEGGRGREEKEEERAYIIPPCTTGISIPNDSVKKVLIALLSLRRREGELRMKSVRETNRGRATQGNAHMIWRV